MKVKLVKPSRNVKVFFLFCGLEQNSQNLKTTCDLDGKRKLITEYAKYSNRIII